MIGAANPLAGRDGQQQALPWQPVGQLLRRRNAAGAPRLEALGQRSDEMAMPREAVRRRLSIWLDALSGLTLTAPLRNLQAAELEGAARGIAFLLVEGLGNLRDR